MVKLPFSEKARRYKKALAGARVTVTQVAKRLGVARSGLSSRLNGGRLYDNEEAIVAELTGTPVEWFSVEAPDLTHLVQEAHPRGAVAIREHANGYTVTLGEAALIAVGRFSAIEQMATELARIAGQSGRALKQAVTEEAPTLASAGAGQAVLHHKQQKAGKATAPQKDTG